MASYPRRSRCHGRRGEVRLRASPSPPSPAPRGDEPPRTERRVLANSPVSVKQQIRESSSLSRTREAESARPLKPLPRTKFRQRKPARRGDDEGGGGGEALEPERTHTLANRERRKGKAQLLIVDGYNVCGCWPKLKELFRAGRIEESRNMLIEELAFFQDVKILAVFDAANSTGPTETVVNQWMTIVYSPDADEYIDEYVSRVEEADICVVTSDNLTRSLAGTAGARLMSSADFVAHVEEQKTKNNKQLKILSLKDQQRGALRYALKDDTRNRLLHMRQSLARGEGGEERRESHGAAWEERAAVGEAPPREEEGKGPKEQGKARRKGKLRGRGSAPGKGRVLEVPSSNPLTMLGSSADNKLRSLRLSLSPPEQEDEGGRGNAARPPHEEGPESVEVESSSEEDVTATGDEGVVVNLYVGFLPSSFKKSDLRSLFEPHGAVKEAKIIMDRSSGKKPVSKGFGFVKISGRSSAEAAVKSLNKKELDGKRIAVRFAKDQGKGRKPTPKR